MAYTGYSEHQPRARRTRGGHQSASDPTSPKGHAMQSVFSKTRTHSRRLIETMKALKDINMDEVQKEYRILMQKAGYKDWLQEENADLETGSDVDEEMMDASELSGGSKRSGAMSAEITALQKELEETKLQLRLKEQELSKKDSEHNEHLSSIQEAVNSEQSNNEEEKRKLEMQLRRIKTEHEDLQKKHQETLSEFSTVKKEKSEALTRLSKIMGTKLTDNNPSIADLSDQNRATKLGEKFAELYDDEWTDALETLTDGKRLTEEKAIKILLDTLKSCFTYAKKKADDQMASLEKQLSAPSSDQGRRLSSESTTDLPVLPQGAKKQLKDLRKSVASEAVDVLFENFEKDQYRGSAVVSSQLSSIPDYVKKCLELCWLMAVQDPPVALGPEAIQYGEFDTNLYRHYTTTGGSVNYVVWPPLCLHDNGPILCKGVAQPYPTKEPVSKDRTHGRAKTAPASRNVAATLYSSNVTGNTGPSTESRDQSAGMVNQQFAGRAERSDNRGQTSRSTGLTPSYQSTAMFDPLRTQATNNHYYSNERRSPRPDQHDQQQHQYNQITSYGRGIMPGGTQPFAQTRGTPGSYSTEVVPTSRNTAHTTTLRNTGYTGQGTYNWLYGAPTGHSNI